MLGRILLILAILELYGTVLWYLTGLFQEPTKIQQILNICARFQFIACQLQIKPSLLCVELDPINLSSASWHNVQFCQ